MFNSEVETLIKKIPIDECYKLIHLLEERVDNTAWKNNIKQSLTPSGIYVFYDTTTQTHDNILIKEISDNALHGYRVSDGNNITTPVESISLERSYQYLGPDRIKYSLSALPTMDETPLIGVNNLGFTTLCAGLKLENGHQYIFSPILEDKEIDKSENTFYVATDQEREIMDTLLGR